MLASIVDDIVPEKPIQEDEWIKVPCEAEVFEVNQKGILTIHKSTLFKMTKDYLEDTNNACECEIGDR